MFALHPSTPSRLHAGAARSDVRQSLTAVCSRTGTGGGALGLIGESERGRKVATALSRASTDEDECGTPVCPHQFPSDNPSHSLSHPRWLFLPPSPLRAPLPSNPCWLWTPWTGPREKAKLPGSLLRCPIDLIVFSAGHVWGTLGGLLPQLCKAWGVPFLPNLHNNIIPNSSAFCQLFPSISPQPNH